MRLTTYLLSRLVLSGAVILLIAVSWLMFTNHQRVQNEVAQASNTIMRILEVQTVGPLQGIGLEPRFLDWYPVTQVSLPVGACVKLLTSEGKARQTTCKGKGLVRNEVPKWFTWIYRRVFNVAEVSRSSFQVREHHYTVEIAPDAGTEIADVWARTKLAFTLATLVIFVLGVTAAWLINNAVKPVRMIVDSLENIGKGNFESKLGTFRFRELNQIASTCNKLASDLNREKRHRDTLFQRLQTVQEDERRAIALELHDEFGQYLTAISANALALQSTNEMHVVKSDAQRIQHSAERLKVLVGNLLRRLRPYPASESSLIEMINNLITEARESQSEPLQLELETDGPVNQCADKITPKITLAAYRIIQEALTNIRKHASADRVKIRLSATQDALEVAVCDNGKLENIESIRTGFGISGMRERAASVGGRLELSSAGKHGLTVRANFPLSVSVA